jgi:hypothetical protein
MKVYFSASLSRYRGLLPLTSDIASMIEELGHIVTSKHVIRDKTTEGEWQDRYDPRRLYEREMRRLATSDVLISEATTPSFGAGFLVQMAISMGKPLLTLHFGEHEKKAPLMLRGNPSINLNLYTEDTIKHTLKSFFQEVSDSKRAAEPLEDFDQ